MRHEYTFGLNRIYLLFAELGFTTTFLVSVNTHVIEQFGRDIAAIPIPRFIEWGARNFIPFDDRTILLRSLLFPAFSTDPTRGIWQGATVTYVAMQLAFYMGFNPVILIGVDHSFVTQGDPHKLVVSQGDDPNHFAANYFGKGTRWQLPDLETSEIAYHLARDTYTRHQRRILDATVGGQLMVFPKVAYESLF
ncbi:MAG: hypothetical protein HC837_00075 [Chloroflexaceae bacterium]|nr:hypothetical protein [Chloroflexaceae bacterium]